MAQRTVVTFECDLDGKHEGDIETETFSVGGQAREIDLCRGHKQKFDKAFEPFLEASRRVTSARVLPMRRPQSQSQSRSPERRQESEAIRQWARETGRKVSDHGRLPVSLISDYAAAH